MSTLRKLSHHNIIIEEFDKAVLYEKVVYPWCNRSVLVSTGPLCWGRTVEIPEGSYIRTTHDRNRDPEYVRCSQEYLMDDVGDCLEIIQVVQEAPIRLECTRYIAFDHCDDDLDYTATVPLDNQYLFHREEGGIVIDGCKGGTECILIPPAIHGSKVLRASLGDTPLPEECKTLIVSEGIPLLDVTFHDNFALERLEIPDSVKLATPPTHISFSRWFRKQPLNQPVYLGGYYCGSPGHGSGGDTELVIRDGTVGIVDNADFQCYWHRIHIPDSVQHIGDFAFFNAFCLKELRLPAVMSSFGCSAFFECPRLRSLRLPDGLNEPVHAFQNCSALQKVSLPASCWDEHTHSFSQCPRIEIRRGSMTIDYTNEAAPQPVTGTLTAYPANGPFFIEGRKYDSSAALTRQPQGRPNHFADCYGFPVRLARYIDGTLYDNDGHPYCQNYWFVSSGRDITMVTTDQMKGNYLVLEGVTAQDVPLSVRKKVADLFPEGRGGHE